MKLQWEIYWNDCWMEAKGNFYTYCIYSVCDATSYRLEISKSMDSPFESKNITDCLNCAENHHLIMDNK